MQQPTEKPLKVYLGLLFLLRDVVHLWFIHNHDHACTLYNLFTKLPVSSPEHVGHLFLTYENLWQEFLERA